MPYDSETASRSRVNPGSARGSLDQLDTVDRILIGACAASWLAALGAGVAATVALVDLGSRHPQTLDNSETPWLLYTVIAVSAVVIVGAVPLLLRARRSALTEPPPAGKPDAADRGSGEAPTEKLKVPATGTGQAYRPGFAAVPTTRRSGLDGRVAVAADQVWLRCAAGIGCAMGVGLLAVGVATYLMAVEHDTASWAVYGVAGVITLAMPAIPWWYLRQLRGLLDGTPA
jgi:uncharacterized protein DUF2561